MRRGWAMGHNGKDAGQACSSYGRVGGPVAPRCRRRGGLSFAELEISEGSLAEVRKQEKAARSGSGCLGAGHEAVNIRTARVAYYEPSCLYD
jgi:hypothetical protein